MTDKQIEAKACDHRGPRNLKYDHTECALCGQILTDSGWGIASGLWFKDLQHANFYRKYGRMPDAPAAPTERGESSLPVELRGLKDAIAKADGRWVECTGCYDTEDGRPTRKYAYSDIFGCELGLGCSECGGLGVVWDDTDYAAMGAFMEQHDAAPTEGARDASAQQDEREAMSDEALARICMAYYSARVSYKGDHEAGLRAARDAQQLRAGVQYAKKPNAPYAPLQVQADAADALRWIMLFAQAIKEPCGEDPESPATIRNAKLATIAQVAAQGLGIVGGPSLSHPDPLLAECVEAIKRVTLFLADERMGSWSYIEGGEFYGDLSDEVAALRTTLAKVQAAKEGKS